MNRKRITTLKRITLSVGLLLAGGMLASTVHAGSLEPPGPPEPTMKTLEQTTGAWDQVLPAAERFVLVMGGAAVLDKETNLVWDQSPETTSHTWGDALVLCINRTVGGRRGWRLPSVHALTSLLDPNNSLGNPDLPAGHSFSNIVWTGYWSASSSALDPTKAWNVFLEVTNNNTSLPLAKTDSASVWCVRGGGPLSEY